MTTGIYERKPREGTQICEHCGKLIKGDFHYQRDCIFVDWRRY